jgi:hypothetical protein
MSRIPLSARPEFLNDSGESLRNSERRDSAESGRDATGEFFSSR